MSIKLINIGFNNVVVAERIIAVVAPQSSPVKRLIQDAKKKSSLINATCGRLTRSVIITDSNHVILSAFEPKVITQRFKGSKK